MIIIIMTHSSARSVSILSKVSLLSVTRTVKTANPAKPSRPFPVVFMRQRCDDPAIFVTEELPRSADGISPFWPPPPTMTIEDEVEENTSLLATAVFE